MDKGINNNGHDYVDLGLPSGTLWATCNVGANNPLESGLYFQWGNIVGHMAYEVGKDKQFNWSDYKWYLSGNDYEENIKFKKYTTTGAKLDLEDDAAHIHMGGDWHMPTPEQIKELLDNTTNTWTTQDGVNGRLFTSKSDNSKSIFIPAAGVAWDDSVQNSGGYGYVWSSMLDTDLVNYGQGLYFDSGNVLLYGSNRCNGLSVRGVIDKSNDNSKDKKNNMEKNKDLNLVEKLKDAPNGMKLYSPICGDCEFLEIDINFKAYPIVCIGVDDGLEWHFKANGSFTENTGVECLLFPSKENRDWSTFKVPKTHKEFELNQKVLVGLPFNNQYIWKRDIYLNYDEDTKMHCTFYEKEVPDSLIIPYDKDKDGKQVSSGFQDEQKDKSIYNNGFDYVDLGLPSGTLWATCNVGASRPSDYGWYFQWGDTVGYTAVQVGNYKQFNCKNYKWNPSGDGETFTKYTFKNTLDLEDDAAHVNWGGDWHMPSPTQIQELIDNTTNEWMEQDGVSGRLFTSKKEPSKSIFIPAAGYARTSSIYFNGSSALVWSSMLDTDYARYSNYIYTDFEGTYLSYNDRCYGFSVRGVIG